MIVSALAAFIRNEIFLAFSLCTRLAFVLVPGWLFSRLSHPLWLVLLFLWLFAVVLGSALSAVRHADNLAARLGEPYGTLILTFSVTFIEVTSISAVMLHGANNPTLTRDTLLAVVMIILNGMVGLSLLLGGWRHREQHYNLQGANAYLSVIIPLIVMSLIVPDNTETTAGPTLSHAQQDFLIVVSVGLYFVFLVMQTGRHRGYFTMGDDAAYHAAAIARPDPPLLHTVLLIAYIAPVVFLAEQLAHPIDYVIETLGFPTMVGGVTMAVLVATYIALIIQG